MDWYLLLILRSNLKCGSRILFSDPSYDVEAALHHWSPDEGLVGIFCGGGSQGHKGQTRSWTRTFTQGMKCPRYQPKPCPSAWLLFEYIAVVFVVELSNQGLTSPIIIFQPGLLGLAMTTRTFFPCCSLFFLGGGENNFSRWGGYCQWEFPYRLIFALNGNKLLQLCAVDDLFQHHVGGNQVWEVCSSLRCEVWYQRLTRCLHDSRSQRAQIRGAPSRFVWGGGSCPQIVQNSNVFWGVSSVIIWNSLE